MIRRIMLGTIAFAGIVGGVWFLSRRGSVGLQDEGDAVQWPFDKDELRTLMSSVVAGQHERINSIEDAAGRERATAFLEYYERRRQAAS